MLQKLLTQLHPVTSFKVIHKIVWMLICKRFRNVPWTPDTLNTIQQLSNDFPFIVFCTRDSRFSRIYSNLIELLIYNKNDFEIKALKKLKELVSLSLLICCNLEEVDIEQMLCQFLLTFITFDNQTASHDLLYFKLSENNKKT